MKRIIIVLGLILAVSGAVEARRIPRDSLEAYLDDAINDFWPHIENMRLASETELDYLQRSMGGFSTRDLLLAMKHLRSIQEAYILVIRMQWVCKIYKKAMPAALDRVSSEILCPEFGQLLSDMEAKCSLLQGKISSSENVTFVAKATEARDHLSRIVADLSESLPPDCQRKWDNYNLRLRGVADSLSGKKAKFKAPFISMPSDSGK